MKVKFKYNLLSLFIFLLNIISSNLTPINNTRNIYNFNSVINILIKGNRTLNFINNKFKPVPNKVLFNGINNNNINNISLIFEEKIISCKSMFKNVVNIIEIDLSKFDFSEVKNMENMFSGLINLKNIYFGNVNISSIENLNCLFYNCYKLTSIDLSNFNSSKITTMEKMFYGCKSLKYLNLYYFNINNNINIDNNIFDGISSDTKYCVRYEEKQKYLLDNNKLLDCSYFFSHNKRKLFVCLRYKYNDDCLDECPKNTCFKEVSLSKKCYDEAPNGYYLDKNNKECQKCHESCISCYGKGNQTINNCIKCIEGLRLLDEINYNTNCFDDCITYSFGRHQQYYYFDENNKFKCTESCPIEYNKIIKEKNKCIDDCKKDDKYKYEYNSKCYINCPDSTYTKDDIEEYLCYDKTPDDYYLDKENNTYKRCYNTCNKCDKKGDEMNNNCLECKDNYTFYINLNNIKNCYEKCNYYYYFNETNELNCVETCPIEYNKTIKEKNKCIDDCKNDNIYNYIYEYNNTCYQQCPDNTYIIEDKNDFICYDNVTDGYYLDNENKIYKRCYNTCNKCDKKGDEINNNCVECKDNYTFYNNSMNIQNCYETCKGYYYFNESNDFHCVQTCQGKYNKIIISKNKCIDNCKYDDIYNYEYNNICYENCPNDTYILEDKEDNICYDKTPIGYYLYKEKEIYKRCYETCNKCDKKGDEINNNCLECKDNYTFYNNSMNISNCYEICKYYYYFNESNEFNCIEKCQGKYNKTIISKNKCIDECKKDDIYQYEYNNICYEKCPNDTYALEDKEDYLCFDKALDGYYLDVDNNIYKRCYETCYICDKSGNESIHNCLECKDNYKFYINSINISNCYENCTYYYYFDELNIFHCNETCPIEYNKIIKDKNKCIDDCSKDDIYKYEYNNICYQYCPNDTYVLEDNKDNICYDEAPIGFYLDKENEIYKRCYETCNKCNQGGNKINNNCLKCKTNYTFYNNSMNISNCYEKCNYYYYFNEINEFICTESCPIEYNKTIKEKNKCIDDCKKDDKYKYEYNNICYDKCPKKTYLNETNYICYPIKTNEIAKEELAQNLQQFREEYIFDFNISANQEDFIRVKDNMAFQVTTSDNQKNNTNKNITSIDLGLCEKELKKRYNIDESLPLIIFKIDYYSDDTLIPIVGYEIYHPLNKSKLDLKYCEDILIKLNIPVNIDESKLYKYDPNSDFYNDNCFSYTTENGTDIILNDRKQEYNNNNLSLCQNDCNYTGYNTNDKQSSCDCNVKNKMDIISDIIDNPNKLSTNFDSEESASSSSSASSNIISIKCTKALFSKDGLKNNISSYIILIFIAHFLLSILLFIKCGYHLLDEKTKKILQQKEKISKELNKKKSKKIFGKKNNYPPKKNYKLNFFNNNQKDKSNSKSKLNVSNLNKKIKNFNKGNKRFKNILKTKIGKNNNNNEDDTNLNNNNNISKIKITYNDYELNSLDYNNAILYDKRTCCEYYLSLIKRKNILIFAFCPIDDYNSMIIKSCIFSLSFSIYYAINFFFFDDTLLHEIYQEGGRYDIFFFLPKISISFFSAYYITTIIKLIFLSERNINNIKKQSTVSNAYYVTYKEKKNLVIKYTIFFIAGLIFLVFFWMLLSSFGAVYSNTQIFIFKNTLISFAMALFYPFFSNILPSLFRTCAINNNKKDSDGLYKFSKFLQLL